MKITGIIEDKEITQKDDWTRAGFTIAGKKYSTFDSEIIKNFNKGQTVDMETKTVEKDGKTYDNMTSMNIAEGDVASVEKVAGKDSNGQTAMFVSYAKDIYMCLREKAVNDEMPSVELMKTAIELVKQAKGAFE